MAELRQRKPVNVPPPVQQELEDTSKSKPKRKAQADVESNPLVLAAMFIIFSLSVGSFLWYKMDNGGPFATWVNDKFPVIERVLNQPKATPMFGAAAAETTGGLKLTEEELKAYTGKDDTPIYLAIDGTIFDVSASPAFYGPGGHYHHFVGQDATRAWVTECWDEPEQFTWRMDDVDVMFMPKYLDETLEESAAGDFGAEFGAIGASPKEQMQKMAKQALDKVGKVSAKEKERRRDSDVKEAAAKAKETLEHWKKFFSGNEKYKVVGEVILDESRPAPPVPCKKALEKRPMKGGKLEAMMGAAGGMMGAGGVPPGGLKAAKEKPDFVKPTAGDDKKKKEAAEKKKKDAEEKKRKKAEEKRKVEEEKSKAAMVTPKPDEDELEDAVEPNFDDDEVYHEEL